MKICHGRATVIGGIHSIVPLGSREGGVKWKSRKSGDVEIRVNNAKELTLRLYAHFIQGESYESSQKNLPSRFS